MLVANARMYTVEDVTGGAWRTLLSWVARAAAVPLQYLDLDPRDSLDALWRRPDLGCVLMCGYPFATWDEASDGPRPVLLAVTVPADPAAARQPVYRSAIVARAGGPVRSIADLAGMRFAYTLPTSQSGYQAVRHWLIETSGHPGSARQESPGAGGFGQTVGPLVTPRRVVEAILAGTADAGPLDGYWLDLLRLHEPRTAAQLHVVAWTPWTPAPPFVCSAGVDPGLRDRLAAALRDAGRTPALAEVRRALALADIANAAPATYAVLAERAREADAASHGELH